ncbi:DUF5926 family protein [Saccharopolyspora griseoalba]|uniref:DUF5926 family protein n=1 Tax=Saccharopolyspora griseoalba TaxID=1431848 RepID=A0ABW2LNR1_9PSEU
MSKRAAATKPQPEGAVGPRQPCPCGSGKRYKNCHGRSGGAADVIVTRPFEGLAVEPELVALREFVPSATAKLPLRDGSDVTLASVLPMAAAALRRTDDVAFVGMQVQTHSGDISRDLTRAIEWVGRAEPGQSLSVVGPESAEPGSIPPRLQDVLDPEAKLDVELHSDFSWWLPEDVEPTGEVALSLERANAAIMPTDRLNGVEAAYWVDAGEKAHLRWVRREPEEKLLAAMARLSARGELALGEGSRYAGSFRAHGLLVPVWDLDRDMHAREWDEPAAELGRRLEEALTSLDDQQLDAAERRARDGLRGRQVTIR